MAKAIKKAAQGIIAQLVRSEIERLKNPRRASKGVKDAIRLAALEEALERLTD